mmetsp:Transcript_11011/g.16638  ORF Transcript_11011/g.16638 Transcript_11011/m.16638 type:complete len:346 (-) Transcript_11011:197-1234(-)
MGKQKLTKSTKQKAASTIKGGYLPVRVRILAPPAPSTEQAASSSYDTFMFVKEHSNNTVFVTNVVRISQLMNVRSANSSTATITGDDKELLRLVFRRFGSIDKIVLAANPKQMRPTSSANTNTNTNDDTDNEGMPASSIFETEDMKKFAHVTFASSKGVKRVMSCGEDGVVLQQEELDDLLSFDSASIKSSSKEMSNCLAIATRYRARIPPREELSAHCDEIMASFEAAEESERLAMEASAQPDADGFITVTKDSNLVAFGSGKRGRGDDDNDDAEDAGGKRGKSRKRSRKKREPRGSVELKDFYRFQMRDAKRKGVEDLRKRFEEDLKTVKKMKEQKQFKPFAH